MKHSKKKKVGKPKQKKIGEDKGKQSSFSKFFRLGEPRAEILKSIKFLAVFLVGYVLLMLAASLIPMQVFERPVAEMTFGFLGFMGQKGTISYDEPVTVELENGTIIQFSYLCTGLMETIILIAAIAASLGIDWKKRVMGIMAAILATQIFNMLRILVTLSLVLKENSSTMFAEFLHGFIFKITLFFVIVGVYGVWFWWATKKKPKEIFGTLERKKPTQQMMDEIDEGYDEP